MLVLLLTITACQRTDELELRTDRAPLDRRVVLPSGVRGVQWVAVPAYADSGFLEAPEKPYDLYAFIVLDAPVVSPPRNPSPEQAVTLPAAVARAILPAALYAAARAKGASVELSGEALSAPLTLKTREVSLKAAARFDAGLLVRLYLSGGA